MYENQSWQLVNAPDASVSMHLATTYQLSELSYNAALLVIGWLASGWQQAHSLLAGPFL